MIRALPVTALPKPRFRYSPVIEAGPWVIFSGMIALDATTGILQAGGPGAEAAKILANLDAAIDELGLRRDELASARIFTTRFEEFPAVNDAWESWLGASGRAPARTSVGVAALPLGASIEIEFSFYRDNHRE